MDRSGERGLPWGGSYEFVGSLETCHVRVALVGLLPVLVPCYVLVTRSCSSSENLDRRVKMVLVPCVVRVALFFDGYHICFCRLLLR